MKIGQISKATLNIGELSITYNDQTLVMSTLVALLLILGTTHIVFHGKKKGKKWLPYRLMIWFVKGFYDLCVDTLGNKKGKVYFPFICTTFLFVLIANLIGIFPGMKSPTEDLNVCLSLALLCFLVAHGSGVKKKGLIGYLKGYAEPFPFMIPLNIIGEIGQTLSHCFRLFGNIFGGGIIFVLVPYVFFKILASFSLPDIASYTLGEIFSLGLAEKLLYIIAVPIIAVLYTVVYAFFGLFAGSVQALVFMMLAITYIAGQISEDD